ncbi:MAG: hypothetical protein SGJ20_19265 [Planctomycetota bacterium]|nr:hypothetical protein [Planctomycetota bacterium]
MSRILNRIASRLVALLIVSVLAAYPAHALAQEYKQLPVDAKLNSMSKIKLSDERKAVDRMLSGKDPFNEAQIANFFDKVLVPQMTAKENVIVERKAVGQRPATKTSLLPAVRKEIAEISGPQATSKQARDRMNLALYNGMGGIVMGPYHPVARYNAMLAINELNDSVSSSGAVPYSRALGAMKAVAVGATFPEAVRVAGVTGMVRHAQYGTLTPDQIKFLVDLATDTKLRPAQLSDTAYDWMRRRAVDALSHWYKRSPPTKGEAIALAQTILAEKVASVEPVDPAIKKAEGEAEKKLTEKKPAEKRASVELRAEAIKLLLLAKAPLPDGLDTAQLASDISMVAVDACKRELATSLQAGRPVSTEDGVMFYVALSQKALAALNTISPTPKVAELEPLLAAILALTGTESVVKDQIYDNLTKAHAEVESLATGVPLSSVLVTVAPVGGFPQDPNGVGFGGGQPAPAPGGGPGPIRPPGGFIRPPGR